MTRSEPVIIDLTRETPPPNTSDPIILNCEHGGLHVRDTSHPGDKPDKGSRRKRKRSSNVEDGELLESSTHASSSHSRNREASNTKTSLRHEKEKTEQYQDGKHQHSHNRSREQSPRRLPSPMPHLPPSDTLFFVDLNPAPITLKDKSPKFDPLLAEDIHTLLLPSHVSVFGSAERLLPVEILPPTAPNPDDDYIQYLDYNDSKIPGLVRYFDEAVDDTKPTRFMCKNCGLEGEHRTSECLVIVCLTCGARDEHSTRSCPISKTCFSCGMKGHINRTCPNRYAAGVKEAGEYNDCDRCGSEMHKTNECPTLWRIYEYLADNDRESTLRLREEKRKLGLGKGGEGYIALNEWCYNCGDCGHLGDDCHEVPHLSDIPEEPSAFSEYNTMSGPFDLNELKSPSRRRELRDWERDSSKGFNASINVGREGRKKERARMEQKAKQQEGNNDPDDWFGNPRNVRNRGPVSSHRDGGKVKKLNFVVKDAGRQSQPPSSVPPRDQRHTDSLLSRLGGDGDRGKSRGRYHDRPPGREHEFRSGERREGTRDRYNSRDSLNTGPRYKGSYSR